MDRKFIKKIKEENNTMENNDQRTTRGSRFEDEFKTEEKIVKVYWDRVAETMYEGVKDLTRGSTKVKNWKFVALAGGLVVAPLVTSGITLVYMWLNFMFSDKGEVDFEEGVHYEMEQREYRVKE